LKTIPNHYDAAAASVNQGVPILKLAPTSPITKALEEFVKSLTGESGAEASASWIKRLLKREA